jgi:hypothetical protein
VAKLETKGDFLVKKLTLLGFTERLVRKDFKRAETIVFVRPAKIYSPGLSGAKATHELELLKERRSGKYIFKELKIHNYIPLGTAHNERPPPDPP